MPSTDFDTLTQLYNNLDTELPDDAKFYVECTDVRGGDELAEKLCDDLSRSNGSLHVLFSGNIGCGKSAELRHFAKQMDTESPPIGRKRFLPIVIDTSEYLDRTDVNFIDVLLALLNETASVIHNRTGAEFRPIFFENLLNSLNQYVPASVEAQVGGLQFPGFKGVLAQIKIALQRLPKAPTVRERVREAFNKDTLTFLEEINLAFVEARLALKNYLVPPSQGGYHDFVIILDNLEKIARFEGKPDDEPSHKAFFIGKAGQLQAINAHIVFTVPLSLLRSEGGKLKQFYSGAPLILPNIKTEHRGSDHIPYEAGRERLRTILRKRLPEDTELDAVFSPDAVDFIIADSGGHVRNFLRFARESISYSKGVLPITRAVARKSIGREVRLFADLMRPEDWNLVADLELSDLQQWDSHTQERARLLEQIVVLEYVNGDTTDESDGIDSAEDDKYNVYKEQVPWYGVNPIIRKMPQFSPAIQRVKEARAKAQEMEQAELIALERASQFP